MSLSGITVDAMNAAHPAMSSAIAGHKTCGTLPAADWIAIQSGRTPAFCSERPTMAARGIVIGLLMSIPLWTLFVAAAYAMI